MSIEKSTEYEIGFAEGYKKGHNEALEYFREQLLLSHLNRPIQFSMEKDSDEIIYKASCDLVPLNDIEKGD